MIKKIDLPPIHDNVNVKKKYWINFLLSMLALIGLIQLVDSLPMTDRTITTNSVAVASPLMVEPEVVELAPSEIMQMEDANQVVTTQVAAPDVLAVVKTKTPVSTDSDVSEAEITLKNTEIEFSTSSHQDVLDLATQEVVFKKEVLVNRASHEEHGMQIAKNLLAQQRIGEAIVELEKLLVDNESMLSARLLLATTLQSDNQQQLAIDTYVQGLALDPSQSLLAEPLAHLLVDKGQVKQALGYLINAAPAYQAAPKYHSMMAALYQQTGQHQNAASIYQKILSLETNNGKWWLGLGISLMATEQDKQAKAAFQWALQDERVPTSLKQFAEQKINELTVRGRL